MLGRQAVPVHILNVSPLPDVGFENSVFLPVACLFLSSMVAFKEQQQQQKIYYLLIYFYI